MTTGKFRGKSLDDGGWVYGGLIRDCNGKPMIHLAGYDAAGIGFETRHRVDEKTIGQLTGEIDKYGKSVWEGDRVLAEGLNGVILTLEIGRGKRGFIQIDEEDGYIYADWFFKLEIIGNIHDDPIFSSGMNGEDRYDPWRCEKCGSTAMQQRVWRDVNSMEVVREDDCDRHDYYCSVCEENHYPVRESELLQKADEWWGETDFREMERITRFRQLDFDPEDGYQAFVDACNGWWDGHSTDKKINIYLKIL